MFLESGFEKLKRLENVFGFETVYIREKSTGKTGIACVYDTACVLVNYGADDGSDDKIITPDEFNRDFSITGATTD